MNLFINCATGLGNIILFMPAFFAFRNKYPDWRYTIVFDNRWYNDPFFRDQFGDKCEFVLVDNSKRSLLKFLFTILKLRMKKFDVAVGPFCGNSWKVGSLLLLIGAKKTIYFKSTSSLLNRQFDTVCSVKNNTHYIYRNYDQLKEYDIQNDIPEKWIFVNDEIIKNIKEKKKPHLWIGIHAGGNIEFNSARLWPREKYKVLISMLQENERIRFVLFGYGKAEQEINQFISSSVQINRCILIRDQSLTEIAAYISCCDVFLGNDSGLMHLSVALNVPTIGILGPTNPRNTGPFGKNGHLVSMNLECMPCYNSGYSMKCPDKKCLTQLEAGVVYNKVRQVLNDSI